MRKSSICKKLFCFLLTGLLVFGGCGKEKERYLPEAEKDRIVTMIGG